MAKMTDEERKAKQDVLFARLVPTMLHDSDFLIVLRIHAYLHFALVSHLRNLLDNPDEIVSADPDKHPPFTACYPGCAAWETWMTLCPGFSARSIRCGIVLRTA